MKKLILPSFGTTCLLFFMQIAGAQTPSISSFSPQSGPVGTTITVTGTGFDATPANNIVHFGAVKANVISATPTSLTVTAPPGIGFQDINVLNSASSLSGYSAFPFTTTFATCEPLNANSLSTKTDQTAGAVTRSVVFADLDGDGKSDMIATNTGGNSISVFQNNSTAGTASFAGKLDFTTGVGTSGIATGDLNGDGKLDIVTSNYNSMDISIFINITSSSTITFATRIDLPTWDILPPDGFINPLGVAINDMNGDGKPDIAVANFSNADVALFRNTTTVGATPTFVRQLLTTGLVSPRELALGDMDGDGKPDLVVADELDDKILAYHNTSPVGAAFTFDLPVTAASGDGPRGVSLGDLDGDGKLDVAVVNSGSASISVFHNLSTSGSISLSAKTDYTSGASPREIALADIDGDGRIEMAASSNTPTNARLTMFRNISTPGATSFATMTAFSAGNNALGVALEDVDNDGKIDAAVTSSSTGTVGVFRNISPVSTISDIAPSTIVASTNVCDNGLWKTIYDGSSGVLAAIKDNNNNLGSISGSVYVEGQPGMVDGQHYMARHFVITPTTQPSTDVQVRLYFTDAELLDLETADPDVVHSVTDLSITRYSGLNEDDVYSTSGGTSVLIPSTSITTGIEYGVHYLEFTTSGFSEFWIHSGLKALPVNLTSFTADKKAKEILLRWTTSSEENSDRFIVERSADGLNFSAIGAVAAAGNYVGNRTYSYSDVNPLNGKNYYRLQQVDRDGRKTVSKTLMVNQIPGANITVILAYQSAKQIRAAINGKVNHGVFIVYDGSGRKVKTYQVNTADAGTVLDIDLSAYGAGIYPYQLITNQGSISNGKILLR